MSWICVGCSDKEPDNNEVMGFGLCKDCRIKVKEAAVLVKANSKKFHRK